MLNFFGMLEPDKSLLIWTLFALLMAMLLPIIILLFFTYKKAPSGQALVRTGAGGSRVIFDGGFVFPMIHKAEFINIAMHIIPLNFSGRESLKLKSGEQVEADMNFYVRINPNDILQVAQSVNCERTFDEKFIKSLFAPVFTEGILTVAENIELKEEESFPRQKFNKSVLHAIGVNLNGFILEDLAIPKINVIKQK
jgi:flotillin